MTAPGPDAALPEAPALRLSHGRTLTVRPVLPCDGDGIGALYERLDFGDRYRRFFSGYRPPPEFFERLAGADRPGEFRLVAVVGDQRRDEIVGEAGYTPLPDGDGELAITVDRAWRGWLGPYLLDRLLDSARARGVPNLQADILVTNAAMLTMARARGYAVMGHADGTVIRVLMGTEGYMPVWPGPHSRPRVLVEIPGARWHAQAEAQRAGMQVLACPGPQARWRCPALSGEPCPLAASADVIVVSHPPNHRRWHDLRSAHARVHAAVPVLEEATDSDRAGVMRSIRELVPVTFGPGDTAGDGAETGSEADAAIQGGRDGTDASPE